MRVCKVFEFRERRKVDQPLRPAVQDNFPALPVLPETRLFIELSVGENSVGVADLTGVILRDLGATLQILRAADRDTDSCEGCLNRLEDCISALGLHDCVKALTDDVSVKSGLWPEVRHAWEHARHIAETCKQLAEDGVSTISPREAYLIGLFHGLSDLPHLLGWQPATARHDAAALLHVWPLPDCVRLYFQERHASGLNTPLSDLVRSAHEFLGEKHE